jgi:hypothetical protein
MAAVETRRTGTLRVPIPLTSLGQDLDTSPEAFGELRRSDEIAHDMQALRARMAEDGYLYLPGYLDRDLVLEARRVLCHQLAERGLLDPRRPVEEAVVRPAEEGGLADRLGDMGSRNALVRANGPLMRLLYGGRMLAFYERFLGGPVRHFDYTWLRVVRPGGATAAHYDIVFMGRGTTNLYTAWTPLGDIDLQLGGLMVLEGSHRIEELRHGYGRTDVDTYCENRFDGAWLAPDGTRNRPEAASGYISRDHPGLQERLGGRWLTAEYRAGDLLTFTMYTAHASIDNRTDRWRLSTDSRYQLASEPVDGRWIGPDPIGHGPNAARGVIC